MISRRRQLQSFKLYAVTDIKKYDLAYIVKIEKALQGGADIIQLRSKSLTDSEFYNIGKKVRSIVTKYGKLFCVNDRPDMCSALNADGVHVGQDDLPVSAVRKIIPRGRLIGKSTHSVSQALKTMREDIDYIGFGPLFGTPTKPNYIPVGLHDIAEVTKKATMPVVCIGGIDLSRIESVIDAGATRVAVVRAIFAERDIELATKKMKWFLN